MQMTQAVKGCVLTRVRLDRKHLGERLKIHLLQFRVLATSFPTSIPAVPVIAERVPPHLDRTFQCFPSEQTFEQIIHASDARDSEQQRDV